MGKTQTNSPAMQSEHERAAHIRAAYPQAKHAHADPLWMPKGSVRAMITIIATVGFGVAVTYSMMTGISIPESLSSIVITIIAFYFGTRANGKEVDGNQIEVTGNFSGEADAVAGSKNLAKNR